MTVAAKPAVTISRLGKEGITAHAKKDLYAAKGQRHALQHFRLPKTAEKARAVPSTLGMWWRWGS